MRFRDFDDDEFDNYRSKKKAKEEDIRQRRKQKRSPEFEGGRDKKRDKPNRRPQDDDMNF